MTEKDENGNNISYLSCYEACPLHAPNLKEEEHNEIKRNDDNFLSVLELMSYTKYINGYHKLNSELKKELEDFSKKSLEKILYKYIKNMSNYGFNFNEMKILTLNFSAQFGFNNDLKENFINLIDCYKYKNYNQNRINLHLINEKNIINDDSLIRILSNIFIFVPIKERIQLAVISSETNNLGELNILFGSPKHGIYFT